MVMTTVGGGRMDKGAYEGPLVRVVDPWSRLLEVDPDQWTLVRTFVHADPPRPPPSSSAAAVLITIIGVLSAVTMVVRAHDDDGMKVLVFTNTETKKRLLAPLELQT
jgi:hypothetical protein